MKQKWQHFKQNHPKLWGFIWQAVLVVIVLGVVQAYQARGLAKEAAPPFTLTAIDGQTISLLPTTADKTLVYFFAPWCTICKVNFDNLERLRSWRSSEKLRILAVALAYDTRQDIHDFLEGRTTSFPVLYTDGQIGAPLSQSDGQIGTLYKISAFPTFYVIDKQGKITSSGLGYSTTIGLWWRTL